VHAPQYVVLGAAEREFERVLRMPGAEAVDRVLREPAGRFELFGDLAAGRLDARQLGEPPDPGVRDAFLHLCGGPGIGTDRWAEPDRERAVRLEVRRQRTQPLVEWAGPVDDRPFGEVRERVAVQPRD